MLTATLRRPLLAVGVALALTPALVAAPVTPEAKAQSGSPAEKTKHKLDQTISIEIANQPLKLALKQLEEQAKINVVIDQFMLQQMGIDTESMPINLKLKDVKVKTALRNILTQSNLGYAIIGDTVFVSTEEMAMYRQMRQRVSVDKEKVELAAALRELGRETATNLLIDTRIGKEAKTEVTLQLDDVPLETAVRLMCEMASVKPVRVGNVLFVTSEANANKLRADPDLAQPQNPNPRLEMMLQQQGFAPGGLVPGGVVPVPQPPGAPPAVPAEKTVEAVPDKAPEERKP